MNRTIKIGFAALALAAVAPAFAQNETNAEGPVGYTPVAIGLATPVQLPWGLNRWDVYGLDLNQMAELGGTSYSLMRRYIRRSPWTWPESVRENLCKELGLKVNVVFSPDRITVEGENV